ncbi:hypothetical protein BJ165DRAFT_1407324 [Panaeolus papilionaceus]|nr:hypothetical protein BJ165DRAFT_1407324 [Panaeolus papilionaceus]
MTMKDVIYVDPPSFDIDEIAKTVTQAEMLEMPEDDLYNLFSLSPLSSLESSRSGSPTTSQVSIPIDPITPSTFPNDFDQIPSTQEGKNERRRKAKKVKGHANRKKKRAEKAKENGLVQIRRDAIQKHVLVNLPIHSTNDTAEALTTKGSYIGGRSKFEEKRLYKLEDLVGPGSLGFTLVEWNGW